MQSKSYWDENSVKTPFLILCIPSSAPVDAYVQHDPQLPCYLTAETAPYYLQSREVGNVANNLLLLRSTVVFVFYESVELDFAGSVVLLYYGSVILVYSGSV